MNKNSYLTPSQVKKSFNQNEANFTVSSRGIREDIHVINYLKIFFMYLPIKNIKSLFGFTTDFIPLYGGRGFDKNFALTTKHITQLYDNNIGLSLTLTNHNLSDEAYISSYELLKKHHRKGNSIVCVNDELAKRVKNDFPHYKVKASIIKELDTIPKVTKALKLYDSVVIPMDMNDNDAFLNALPQKEKITLFANANCAYNCPARVCYNTISHDIFGKKTTNMQNCSKDVIPRLDQGHVFFDVEKLIKLEFTHFKLVPNLAINSLNVVRRMS